MLEPTRQVVPVSLDLLILVQVDKLYNVILIQIQVSFLYHGFAMICKSDSIHLAGNTIARNVRTFWNSMQFLIVAFFCE